MKKFLLFFAMISAFVLCSCSKTLPEGAGSTEPIRAETSTECVLPKETDATEPSSAEGATENVSILFMGERITAPASYPNVPDAYAPVLDDLYLYGELLHRYETLNRNGEVAQGILNECEEVQDEIQKRGYVTYPHGGIEGASGYALADLNGDKNPELLLLDTSQDYLRKQNPGIYAVFTIQNGQLTHIKDSSKLGDQTILAADGTFYRCVDYMGAGYCSLDAFRLEAGKSEFTTISQANAALSFSDGDVPVPYWVKTENGKEVRMSEKEFDILFEQHNHPEKRMTLHFVPLHPGAVNPYDIPTSSDDLPNISVRYPNSYKGAPSSYNPILDDLYLLSERLNRNETINDGRAFGDTGFVDPPPYGKLGYCVKDFNNDGTPELFLGSIDGTELFPRSVFTLKSGKPILLISFFRRCRGAIATDGTIYTIGSSGAAHASLSSYRLDAHANSLTELTDIHSDYSDLEQKAYYVEVLDGKNHYITKQKFQDLREKYENPPERMKLKPFPIANGKSVVS